MEEQVFGRSIGSYELISRINQGSISELYKVRSKETGDIFAMRRMLKHLTEDTEARASFAGGADIEVDLEHQNIVKVFAVHAKEQEPYIIIEYVEGDNLKQKILNKQIDTLGEAVRIIFELGEALNYLHNQNIIHHDIKPENVLLSKEGAIKLTDFSLAILKKKPYILSRKISGSPSYVAPEIIRYRKYDERIDIYSFGITAYELIAGRLPYSGSTPQETLKMHLSRTIKPVALHRLRPEVPMKLEKAVERAMEKSRKKRYPHISLFLRDLKVVVREHNLKT